ncbi:hypothetical protein GLW04_19400 [Halobacillus litoralis]|uniref:Uncharacterized protein n=1 Tax=Halobacillus litoralis TaxID=45668 RepID=A0A845E8R6_9BACI|nr:MULTISPECIES: hypothetical protein [Halobacillus]MYL22044.1 hypothetical protein [Halobacillus litoralis]MYL31969.1 hypothetical protein [Halobacillus halophilus]MYL39965.1 hypothetical protein [Halobacillus litoralis]
MYTYTEEEKYNIQKKIEDIKNKLPDRAELEFDYENNALHVRANKSLHSNFRRQGKIKSKSKIFEEKIKPEDIRESKVLRTYDDLDQ